MIRRAQVVKERIIPLETGGRLDRLHIRVHLWWVSRRTRRLLVVTGARCPLTKPVLARGVTVTAVELQATTEPHCRLQPRRAGSPAVFTCTSVQRELTPGGPGSGLRPGRKRSLYYALPFFTLFGACDQAASTLEAL
jgi:hypothetical protein